MRKAYQPLHHKYRPENFDELVGQEAISATLKQAIISNRIAPAYLFSGPRGTGKTSSARILAKSLNCLSKEEPSIHPCGKCELCTTIALGTALDVIEIDAASNTGVDNIRELIERSKFAPVQARWKVYVIDECHMLSTAAFNALLKTLEEPSPQVVFVLATTDPQRVLPTILSRCQRFEFRRIPRSPLTKHLKFIASKEAISINQEALHLIAQRAQGGLRDAESLLDQLSLLPQPITTDSVWDLLGEVPEKGLLKLAYCLADKDPVNLLTNCRALIERGKEPLGILQGLASMLRDLVIINAAPNHPELTTFSKDFYKDLLTISKKVDSDQVLDWHSSLKGSEYQIKQSSLPNLWLEVLLLGLLSKQNNNIDQSTDLSNNTTLNKAENKIHPNKLNTKQDKISKEKTNTSDGVLSGRTSIGNEANLIELWQQILGKLELPSTRMLLSQQASLIRLTTDKAFVQVAPNWIGMVQSRSNLLEEAICKTLGDAKVLILEVQPDQPNQVAKLERSEIPKPTTDVKIGSTQKPTTNQFSPPTVPEKINSSSAEDSKDKDQKDRIKSIDLIEKEAKQIAEFFNGEVLETDQ